MGLTSHCRTFPAFAALAALLCLAGCVTPLGPGFRIEHQELNAEYISGAQPAIRVRASWRVKNTGDQPLDAIDAKLPDARTHDRAPARVELNGEVAPVPLDPSSPLVHIAFAEPLPMGGTRGIAVSYDLRAARSESDGADVTVRGFVLPPGDWAPVLLRPKRAFFAGGEPPKKWELTFRVPAGWRVHASGKLKRTERSKQDQPESVVYHFAQRAEDSLPFAVGGPFREEKAPEAGSRVLVWTREAWPAGTAQRSAEAAIATARFYDAAFGPRPESARALWIIECPRSSSCWAVPQAALVGGAIKLDESWSAVQAELDQQLAYTWLDFRVHPDWENEPLPMGTLADYATELATAERLGGDARSRMIHGLLASFEYEKARQPEPSLLRVQLSDPAAARQFARLKSELFFFALEDAVGKENLLRALRHLMKAYPRGVWRADDLRSALEQESGKNLGPVFRDWLVEAGIPAEFHSRY